MSRKMLEAALKTADPLTIFAAMDALVRMSSNVSKLAKDVGTERSALYRTFRGDKGPRLSMMVRVLSSSGFQLIVNAHGSHPQNGQTESQGPMEKNYCSSRTSLESKGMCEVFDKSIRDFGHGRHRESPRRYAACPRKCFRICEKGVVRA